MYGAISRRSTSPNSSGPVAELQDVPAFSLTSAL
jgi:hypothetical protein